MQFEFPNDGSYGEKCLLRPFLINEYPIGFIRGVTEYTVTCEIFDNFFFKDQVDIDVISNEQNITGVGFITPKQKEALKELYGL